MDLLAWPARPPQRSQRPIWGLLCLLPLLLRGHAMEDPRRWDRDFQRFSPEGRLYQVQYAEKAAKRGAPVVAVSNGRDTAVLCVERPRGSILEDLVTSEKISAVQDGVWMAFAGLTADGRRLLDKARLHSENFWFQYSDRCRTRDVALYIADLQHRNTFVRAQRPYGVSCVIAGIDPDGVPRTYVTEPSGVYHEWTAACVGEGAEVGNSILLKHEKEMGGMDGQKLARLAARVVMDVRGPATSEVEVVVLQKEGTKAGRGAVRVRRMFLRGRADLDRIAELWDTAGQGEQEEEA